MTVARFDLSSIDTALGELHLLRRAAFATEQPFVLLSLLMYEVDWLLTNGQIHGAFQIAKRALAHMQEEPNAALVAPAHLRLAQIAYLWNELADAQEHISAGLATAHPEFLLTTVDGYHTQARLYAAQGKWDLAYRTLAIADQFARSGGRHAVCDRIAAWEARLRLVEGDSAAALRWAKQVGCWGGPLTDSLSYDQLLTCCRLLIVLADAEGIRQAEGALRRMLQAAAEKQRTVQRIEIGVLLTWLYSASGKAESAVAQLAEILALVETSGAIRVLLDDGIRIWAPLRRLALAGPLCSVALRVQHAITSSPVNAQQAPYEALNSRELGILQLLAQGCTNTEIAHQQALAVSTVQWYLKHIYRKLDVHNRTQAAMRARDLSLLSSAFPQGRG